MFHVVKRFQNKLILITVSAFIFLFTDVSAQKEWYYRCSTKFDNVVSFSVVDSLYMYVADRKGLHKSTDGGYTWTKLISASYYSAQVIFRSRNNGLLVTSGPIKLTSDGGLTWEPVFDAAAHANIVFTDSLRAVSFRTGTQSNGFPITLARTYDGGATWEWRSTHLYPGVLQWIDQVDSTIWGFGSILTQGYPAPVMGTLVAHSTNDGVTWITDSTYVNYTKWTGLVVMRPNVVIALALDRILKVSTDGGDNFVHYYHPRNLYSLRKSGDSVFYAGSDSGFIASSRDYGITFTYTKLNTNKAIKCLEITKNGDGYALSEDSILFSTIKLKPIPSDIGDSQENTPFSFTLSQNYPNPFNPETVIRFALPEAGYVKGVVYDILGREVTTLLNGEMNSGNHEIMFDAKGIASGVYVFRLEAGKYSSAIKMIVNK